MSFTLTEPNNSLEIDLVDHVENNLEPSFIVFGFLAIFLECYDDLGLGISLVLYVDDELTLADSAPGNLIGV